MFRGMRPRSSWRFNLLGLPHFTPSPPALYLHRRLTLSPSLLGQSPISVLHLAGAYWNIIRGGLISDGLRLSLSLNSVSSGLLTDTSAVFSSNELRTTSTLSFAAVASRSGTSRHEMCNVRRLHSTGFRDGLLVRMCAQVLSRMRRTLRAKFYIRSWYTPRGYLFFVEIIEFHRIAQVHVMVHGIMTGNVARFISEIMVQTGRFFEIRIWGILSWDSAHIYK